MEFLEPWLATCDDSLASELLRELPPNHALHGIAVKVVARRCDQDQVLFSLADGTGRLASVHLTWQPEASPNWPRTIFFNTKEEFQLAMVREHSEYS